MVEGDFPASPHDIVETRYSAIVMTNYPVYLLLRWHFVDFSGAGQIHLRKPAKMTSIRAFTANSEPMTSFWVFGFQS